MRPKHHQMMIDDGLPEFLCRLPGSRPTRAEIKRKLAIDPIEQRQAELRAAQRAIENANARAKRAQAKRNAELKKETMATMPASAKWDQRRCRWVAL